MLSKSHEIHCIWNAFECIWNALHMKQYMQIAQVGLTAISPFLPPVGDPFFTLTAPTSLTTPNPLQYDHNNPPRHWLILCIEILCKITKIGVIIKDRCCSELLSTSQNIFKIFEGVCSQRNICHDTFALLKCEIQGQFSVHFPQKIWTSTNAHV